MTDAFFQGRGGMKALQAKSLIRGKCVCPVPPVMAHFIESGKLTLDDVEQARKALRKLAKKGERGAPGA